MAQENKKEKTRFEIIDELRQYAPSHEILSRVIKRDTASLRQLLLTWSLEHRRLYGKHN